MTRPNKHEPKWNSKKTRRLAEQMEEDATAHEEDAIRREADGWTEGADKATRWAKMKRRAATLLHESADAAARREHARKDVERYQLADIDPADLMPTHLGGSFPEVYECTCCSKEVVVTDQIANNEGGGTDLNGAYRAIFARGWRPVIPHGMLCPSCVDARTGNATTHDELEGLPPDLFS